MLPSLFLVASAFILPSVVPCCLPDVYQALMYFPGSLHNPREIIHSFSKQKFLLKPLNFLEAGYKFRLFDSASGLDYTMLGDGFCAKRNTSEEDMNKFVHKQCLDKHYNKTAGTFTLGKAEMSDYVAETVKSETHIVVSQNDCYPIMTIQHFKDSFNSKTLILTNVKVKGIDESELDQDVSTCV